MRRRTCALAVAVGALGLAGCGDPNEPVVGEATPEPMHAPVDERCEEPSPELIERLRLRLDVEADLEHARQVRSEEEGDLVFVSAELVGDDLDDLPPVATWAVLGEGTDRDVHAVNAIARYHSSWPDGTRRDDALTMATEGAEAAEACVEAAAE